MLPAVRGNSGVLLYEGPSLLDGAPIFAAACGRNQGRPNRKTGPAIQTYIMRSDVWPADAANSGQDASVCGECPLRPAASGVCYVQLGHGAHWCYEAYKRGAYLPLGPKSKRWFEGEYVRIGTYGDPAAVPYSAWEPILPWIANWSGYTHQWRTCDPRYRQLLMASVESVEEAAAAQALGWRTFRLRTKDQELAANEIVCPGSDEGGSRRQCNSCRACTGNHRKVGVGQSVAIEVHGRPWKEAQFRRLMSLPMVAKGEAGMRNKAPARCTRDDAALLTTGAAARIAGVSQQTIIRNLDLGRIEGGRLLGSTHRRVKADSLKAWMVKHGLNGSVGAGKPSQQALAVGESDRPSASRCAGSNPAAPATVLSREATYPIDSGQVSIAWGQIKPDEIDDVADWLGMMIERMKRDAQKVG